MDCRTFLTLEKAKEKILDFCLLMEQDIFIKRISFPSGEEYVFRLHNEITFPDSQSIVYVYFIPLTWHFKDKRNASIQAQKWANKVKETYYVETHREKVNGHNHPAYFTISNKLTKLVELGENEGSKQYPIKPKKLKNGSKEFNTRECCKSYPPA